jgi:hypothetical protein
MIAPKSPRESMTNKMKHYVTSAGGTCMPIRARVPPVKVYYIAFRMHYVCVWSILNPCIHVRGRPVLRGSASLYSGTCAASYMMKFQAGHCDMYIGLSSQFSRHSIPKEKSVSHEYNDCRQCRTLLHTVDAFRARCVARCLEGGNKSGARKVPRSL